MKRTLFMLAALLAALACGPEPEEGFSVRFGSAALAEGTEQIAIYFYGEETTCNEVRTAVPRLRALLGPFVSPPSWTGKEGTFFRRSDIPVGTYVVLVDALSATGAILGTGCAEQQRVLPEVVSRIEVVVE